MKQASPLPRNMAPEFQEPDSEALGTRPHSAPPSGIRISSTPGSGPPRVEQFDLRTPANVPDPESKFDKLEALEKNVKELENTIK